MFMASLFYLIRGVGCIPMAPPWWHTSSKLICNSRAAPPLERFVIPYRLTPSLEKSFAVCICECYHVESVRPRIVGWFFLSWSIGHIYLFTSSFLHAPFYIHGYTTTSVYLLFLFQGLLVSLCLFQPIEVASTLLDRIFVQLVLPQSFSRLPGTSTHLVLSIRVHTVVFLHVSFFFSTFVIPISGSVGFSVFVSAHWDNFHSVGSHFCSACKPFWKECSKVGSRWRMGTRWRTPTVAKSAAPCRLTDSLGTSGCMYHPSSICWGFACVWQWARNPHMWHNRAGHIEACVILFRCTHTKHACIYSWGEEVARLARLLRLPQLEQIARVFQPVRDTTST